ncbi:MAG: DUF1467 family protein [Pseudomonadota bacterium]
MFFGLLTPGDLLLGAFSYVLVWWVTLFLVLPFGISPTRRNREGLDPGAPVNAQVGRKLLVNSCLAFALWGVGWIVWWLVG